MPVYPGALRPRFPPGNLGPLWKAGGFRTKTVLAECRIAGPSVLLSAPDLFLREPAGQPLHERTNSIEDLFGLFLRVAPHDVHGRVAPTRSEERRVGKECRSR